MKRAFFLLGLAAAVLLTAVTSTIFAQDAEQPIQIFTKTIPLEGSNLSRARRAIGGAAAAVTGGSSIPMWNYTVTAPKDGNTYSGTMVGASPYFNGARTTNIPTFIVPLIVVMPDGSRFDPTAPDKCEGQMTTVNLVMGSPLFQTTSFNMNGINMGIGQYIDEFQRANFYDVNVATTGDSYHNSLSPVTVLPAQTITVPANTGASWFLGGCANLGVMTYSTFQSLLANNVFPSLASQGVGPTNFPIFILRNVVMATTGFSPYSNCCVVGYHAAQGFPVQTYAVADVESTGLLNAPDVTAISHEIGEWMDDPLGTNPTPSWGHTGQVSGCSTTLEVGDPLTGWTFATYGVQMPNGIAYHPQQLGFFSWFYGQSPSLGVGGLYSAAGPSTLPILTFPARTCS